MDDVGQREREATVDAAALYEQTRLRMLEIVRALDGDALARSVPATPEWTVHDVVAHVVGITADLNAGNIHPSSGEAWTAAQIDARRDATVEDLAAEWDREAPQFEEGLRLFGYELGAHYVGDLHAHLQDVCATLGLPPERDPLIVSVALDFYLDSLADGLRVLGWGALDVHTPERSVTVGDGPARAAVDADAFELLRALSGRRSERQIRALAWSGDVDAIVPVFSRYLLPADDLRD